MKTKTTPYHPSNFDLERLPHRSTVKTALDVECFSKRTVPAGSTWTIIVSHDALPGYTVETEYRGNVEAANVLRSQVELVQRAVH